MANDLAAAGLQGGIERKGAVAVVFESRGTRHDRARKAVWFRAAARQVRRDGVANPVHFGDDSVISGRAVGQTEEIAKRNLALKHDVAGEFS